MMGRIAVMAALIALAGCASIESAGRNAQRTEMPPPPAETAAPVQEAAPPAQTAQGQAPAAMNTPEQEEAIRQEEEEEGAIVVPGQREMQVQPSGDPRSVAERMRDVRAWDQCITSSQSAFESDPMRPQLDSPEEYCSRNLGMASRTAVPASRR